MNEVFVVVLLLLKAALSPFLYTSFRLTFNQAFLKKWCLLALFLVWSLSEGHDCLWDLILLAVLFYLLLNRLSHFSVIFLLEVTYSCGGFFDFCNSCRDIESECFVSVPFNSKKNWTRSCTHSGTVSLMVSLNSSPWNDYCSAASFVSGLSQCDASLILLGICHRNCISFPHCLSDFS